jgi:hypothetical protein
MSRYFMVQSWVGSHENEPDYNGNQCGQRNVRSSEVVPLYDQYGNANIKAFSDEALLAKKKSQTKKTSAFDSIMLADRNYSRLCGLSEQLDAELDQGLIDLESWAAARKNIDQRLAKAWARVQRERGWEGQEELLALEQYPSQPLDFTLDIGHSRALRINANPIDYSVLPQDSLFNSLSDENLFKISYTKLLTAVKWMAKIAATGKKILEEGLV